MANNDGGKSHWLRPVLTSGEHAAGVVKGELFERGGYVVQPNRRLSQLVNGRPPGITTHQWSVATRTHLDFVVCDTRSYHPMFVLDFDDPSGRMADGQREERMTNAVCDALGLEVLRIETAALSPATHGRRIVEYVIDARTFQEGVDGIGGGGVDREVDPGPESIEQVSYREILGRLPDGRIGFVNDLGAVARVAAVDAFVSRRLVDPLLRVLHTRWKDGSAEGWAWLDVRDGRCLFERVRIWPQRFDCGIAPGRFAEDLAAAAVGERLKTYDLAELPLHDRAELGHELDLLRGRRTEMDGEFAFDHVSFA